MLKSFLPISKFSTVCALTIALILGGNVSAHAEYRPDETREQAIDRQTDWFLYRMNPELGHRKLRSDDYQYINEWNAIRNAVEQEMKPSISLCGGDRYWELNNYDGINGLPSARRGSTTFDRIADAIFYSRYPNLQGTRLSSAHSKEAREWSRIRRSIMHEQPCS